MNRHRTPVCLRVESLEPRATPTTLPAGFTEGLVAGGLHSPSAMAFAPDGRPSRPRDGPSQTGTDTYRFFQKKVPSLSIGPPFVRRDGRAGIQPVDTIRDPGREPETEET